MIKPGNESSSQLTWTTHVGRGEFEMIQFAKLNGDEGRNGCDLGWAQMGGPSEGNLEGGGTWSPPDPIASSVKLALQRICTSALKM